MACVAEVQSFCKETVMFFQRLEPSVALPQPFCCTHFAARTLDTLPGNGYTHITRRLDALNSPLRWT